MIGYDKRGAVFALTEGAELLLHDGESEGPLWRTMLDARIVAVACDAERVIAVTETGRVRTFAATTGDPRGEVSLDGSVTAACADATAERVVAIVAGNIVELRAGACTVIGAANGHAIAMAPDGAVLAATPTELVLYAANRTRTTRPLDVMIHALAHHPEGFWILGMPTKLLRWDGAGEPTHITSLPPNGRLDHVACSERVLAIAWDRHNVAALAWPSKETLGSLQYLERKVEGLAVGPWPWLGVALDLGDGNKFDLVNARLHRSDTHPGRQHHSWLVSVGGSEKAAAPRPAPRAASGGSNPLGIVLAVVAIVLVVVLALR